CFFFQAEDGIRGLTVTGVQTCALPISWMVDVTTQRSSGIGSLHFLHWTMIAYNLNHYFLARPCKSTLPQSVSAPRNLFWNASSQDRKSTRLNSKSQSNLVCRLLLEKKK